MHLLMALSFLVGGGTYEVSQGAALSLVDRGETVSCIAVAPAATFSIEGPASVKVSVRVELPPKGKAKPLPLSMTLDGKRKVHKVRARRSKAAHYEPPREATPSEPAAPIPLRIAAGSHVLVVSVPPRRRACVTLVGLDARAAPVAETSPQVVAPVPAPPPPPEAIAEVATEEASPAAQEPLAASPTAADATLGVSVEPAPQASVHEVRAAAVEEPSIAAEATATPLPAATGDLLRVGALAGGVVPRGELKPGLAAGLLVELPVAWLFGAEVSGFGEAGISPMRQQQETLIPGRGKTELIQNAMVFPCDLGVRARWPLGDDLFVHAGVGLAVDILRAQLNAFSTEAVPQNDVALGLGLGAGVYLPWGPGGLIADARYRETRADLGSLGETAEERLGRASLHLGYLLAFSK